MPRTIILNKFAPVNINAATPKDRLMIPAKGKTLFLGNIIAKISSIGTRIINVTQNSLLPANTGQSTPM